MARSNTEIKIEKELRPCIVSKNCKALFHMWSVVQKIIEPAIARGGHQGGQIQYTLGIVEYEDGTIHECYPHNIRFIDGKINGYCFENMEGKVGGETDS